MKGRLETQIKTENAINVILDNCPDYLIEYYYSIMSSKEPKTCRVCVYAIKKFLTYLNEDLKSIDIKSVTNIDITKYLHEIETIKTYKINSKTNKEECSIRAASASYINSTHSHLKDFFTYLVQSGYINSNPMENVKRIKRKDIVKRPKLDEDDLKKILKTIEEGAGSSKSIAFQEKWRERDRAIFLLFINTGMRETALTEINVNEPDFINNKLTIIDKRHVEHTYFIGASLRQALLDWIKAREIILDGKECDALFISSKLSRISTRSVQMLIGKYSEEALGFKISPHKLRAAFCTILYDKKKDIEFVRDAVGHSSVSVTQRYIVKDDSQRKEASQIMDDLF